METSVYNNFQIYLLAILLGALMGLERERRKERVAGLRTFILVVLFGSICGQISQSGGGGWILLAGVITVAVQSAMMNVLRIHKSLETGLTTAVALLVAFAIGILVAFGQKASAVALSLATTVILYFKPHRLCHA
jgi:uncharacterized membrane protein (DUF4010 family)